MSALATLTEDEVSTLAECEAVIKRGLSTFNEVGAALLTIRETKVYKADYKTFEDYCQRKWNLSQRHVNRHIAASQAISNLGPIGPKPKSESHARPLVKLPPDQQREAWKEAVETAPEGKVTAKHVEEVVKRKTSTREETQQARAGGQVFAEERALVDTATAHLATAFKELKKAHRQYGFSEDSANRVRCALKDIAALLEE